ncbi:carbohydrate kinase family protein [Rugosimonospora africana]|uniref:Fructokinase n=1 Tax=Rugosimonospora africana TaxID=556532 RepID=A0A8J3VMX5_9ACTN|nr:carbohydrate kinase [Rugosimonospora africana]GIH12669.1 fructokinase [Rugosimonospora africana]
MIVVTGENVVDLIAQPDGDLRPVLGGGPATISVAASRLGVPAAMAARIGADVFGPGFRRRLADAGVDGRHLRQTADPSTLALVTLDATGSPHFDFWHSGAADFGWSEGELPAMRPGDIVHIGSLVAFLPPGADAVEQWAAANRPLCTVTFDPNLRPIALAQTDALERLERLVGLAHVVKVSLDDLRMAYPDTAPEDTVRRWRDEHGVDLVLLTRGADGVTAYRATGEASAPAPVVPVVDTIGAGDSLMAAVLACLYRGGDIDLDFICAVAALACTRPGANPPTAAEVSAFLEASPATRRPPVSG